MVDNIKETAFSGYNKIDYIGTRRNTEDLSRLQADKIPSYRENVGTKSHYY